MRALIPLLLAGCTTVVDAVVEPEDLADTAEAYCKANPHLPCGHVYECGDAEVCVLGPWREVPDVEAALGATCEKTERHVGLCWYCCGEGCTAGCNAISGCFCPEGTTP